MNKKMRNAVVKLRTNYFKASQRMHDRWSGTSDSGEAQKEKIAASNIQQTKPTAPKRQTYGKKKKC